MSSHLNHQRRIHNLTKFCPKYYKYICVSVGNADAYANSVCFQVIIDLWAVACQRYAV